MSSSQVFQINYNSQNGPTIISNLSVKTHSPKGFIRIRRQGPAKQLDQQLDDIRQSLNQGQSYTRRCDPMGIDDIFEAFEGVGCSVQGSQADKEAFLKQHSLQRKVQDFTKVLHDDCGPEIVVMAMFRDSQHYFLMESFREWPGYEP